MSAPHTGRPESPLQGKRVVITRARKDIGALRELLENAGATVLELPMIAIAPPEDVAPLDAALRSLDAYHWIVFTSRNAVDAVFDRLSALGLPSRLPADTRVAAIGPSTAHDLGARGVPIHLVPAEATAARLAVHLRGAGVERTKILLPASNLARPQLRAALEAAGAQVDQVVAYRTVRPPDVDPVALDALRREAVDVVALASPSALRNLVDLLGAEASCLQQTRLACVGPTTASAVRELGLHPAVVATDQTPEGLTQAITSLFPESDHEPA